MRQENEEGRNRRQGLITLPRNCWQFLSQFAESLFRTIAHREEEEEELIDDVVCTLMHTGT
jgi:hypothetical protein